MGVECEVEIGDDPAGEATVFRVSGPDGGIVIGRRGQTLDAIEHLMNRIAQRDSPTNPTRVRIDVEGYRERRQESLEQLARRLADKAKATGRVVTLNPMSPRDRRVIHMTLQADADVTTWSEGEGHFRRLLIGPRDERRQSRQRSER
jgi:spoIIIJ-associated protein